MSGNSDDTGTLHALLERLVKFRLPRLLELKQRVDAGERLSDSDLAFLTSAVDDARHSEQFVARNPEFHALGAQIVDLYDAIVRKAIENEKGA